MSYKREIRDPIYGFIEVEQAIIEILDHPLIQRLRWVNQLPLEQLVYPSANHSRFEHSLGVMYLAGLAASALFENSQELVEKAYQLGKYIDNPQKELKHDFILAAKICGLLHDVGHAPFSHTFEDAFKVLPQDEPFYIYDHEDFGYKLVHIILNTINETILNDSMKRLIKRVLNKNIKRRDESLSTTKDGLLNSIENVIRNIIDYEFDVDKGDYLLRDSYHCGVNYGLYEYKRLWTNICLTEQWEIVPNNKAALEVWRLLLGRYFMFENVYGHKFRQRTDAMLVYIIYRIARMSIDSSNNGKPYTTNNIFQDFEFLHKKDNITKQTVQNDFIKWNDQYFISYLRGFNKEELQSIVEDFFRRKIFKELYNVDIFLIDKKKDKPLIIRELWQRTFEEFRDYKVSFYIKEICAPPVYNADVAEKIRVMEILETVGDKVFYKSQNYNTLDTLASFLCLNNGEENQTSECNDEKITYNEKLGKADKALRSTQFRIYIYYDDDVCKEEITNLVNEIIKPYKDNGINSLID